MGGRCDNNVGVLFHLHLDTAIVLVEISNEVVGRQVDDTTCGHLGLTLVGSQLAADALAEFVSGSVF